MTRREKDAQLHQPFTGFDRPESNWFRMPNTWTDITAGITSIAELKVVEYILRHTWGYQEYGLKKHITIDEFVNGRRRQDGSRMDRGTGLSERAVYDGLRKAVEDRLIEEEVDASDRGRIKKSYSLRMREEPVHDLHGAKPQDLPPGVQSLHPAPQMVHPPLQTLPVRGARPASRSEKDTQERHERDSKIRMASPEIQGGLTTTSPSRGPGPTSVADIVEVVPLGEAVQRWRQQRETGPESPSPAARSLSPARREEAVRSETAPIMVRRGGRPRRVVQQEEAYQVIQAYIADFARELNDKAPLKASTMRAYNLYKRSGLEHSAFVAQLYAARAIVKERTASIRSRGEDTAAGFPTKNKAAYFFAVLEDLLGLRDGQGKEPRLG